MNKLIRVFFAFSLLSFVSMGQDGWEEQASGSTDNLNSIFFFNENSGFAVGNNGTAIVTSDGGSNWSSLNSITSSENFQKIYFQNSNDGFLLTQNGMIYKTSNGGTSWSNQSIHSNGLNGIAFSNNNGIIVGDDGAVFTSTDGNSWTPQPSLGVFALNDVVFFSENIAIAVGGNGEAYQSSNKGSSWELVDLGTTNTLSAIQQMDESSVLIAGTDGTVIRYEPISKKSFKEAENLSSAWLKGIACTANGNCLVTGSLNTVLIRSNNTWVSKNLDDNVNLNTIYFTSDAVGYVAGIAGVVYRHNEGGYPISTMEIKAETFSVFPSLVENSILISFPSVGNATLLIYNSIGNLVSTQEVSGNLFSADVSHFEAGLYFIQLTNQKKSFTQKFIKK